MTSLATALVVALALGAGGPSSFDPAARSARAVQTATNAARARAGLLPRKPVRKVRMTTRSGHRIITAASHRPTWLGDPEPIPNAPDDDGAVIELVAAAAPQPTGEPDVEPSPAPAAPVPVSDEVRLYASEVVTEAKLALRFP